MSNTEANRMNSDNKCTDCWQYQNGICRQWKVRLDDINIAGTCIKFSREKQMNKGLQIRQNKLAKKAKKRAEIKAEQVDLVRFVDFSVKVIERIDGKYHHPARTEYGHGLQIKNRIYDLNGHYKMVNRTTLKITKSYGDIPEWANQYLKDLYAKTLGK